MSLTKSQVVLFSTLAGDLDDVEELLHQLQRPGAGIVSQRLWSKVETALEKAFLDTAGFEVPILCMGVLR